MHTYTNEQLEGIVIIRFLPIIRCCVSVICKMMHYMPTTIVHETKQLVSYTTMDGCILFVFFSLTGASLTYMTIENEPVMATFNWPWPAIRWPHLVAAGERPTSLYLPPKNYGCDMHQCDSSPAAACYQLKDYKSNTNKH